MTVGRLFPTLCLFILIPTVQAQSLDNSNASDKEFWYLQTSVINYHFSNNSEHNNHQDLIGLEHSDDSGFLYGAATFRNSYWQRSNYAYVGQRFESADYPVYLKVTGGLLQGYTGKYRNKIPLNGLGIAPAIFPSVGAHYGPATVELVFLYDATMITAGVRF